MPRAITDESRPLVAQPFSRPEAYQRGVNVEIRRYVNPPPPAATPRHNTSSEPASTGGSNQRASVLNYQTRMSSNWREEGELEGL
jgi:hypothetical protein